MLKITTNIAPTPANLALATEAWQKLDAQKATLGFQSILHRADLFEQSKQLADNLRFAKNILFIGIGGSALGPRFLAECGKRKVSLLFLDNVDPILFQKTKTALEHPDDTAVIIVSKSGNTLETLSLANLVVQNLENQKKFDARKFVVVTEKRANPLFNFAQKRNIPISEIPVELGGRYSLFSGVGLVLSQLLDLRTEDLWSGARAAQKDQNLIQSLIGLSLDSFQREEWVTNFWSYSSSMQIFGLWFQQLWAESLGKPGSTASHFVPVVGTMDQHSILQQIAEGRTKQWNLFLSVQSVENTVLRINTNDFDGFDFLKSKSLGEVLKAEREATALALISHGRECLELELTDLSEYSLGYLMMTAQLWTAGLGFALKINPFDQPGVELGKRLALGLLGRKF